MDAVADVVDVDAVGGALAATRAITLDIR